MNTFEQTIIIIIYHKIGPVAQEEKIFKFRECIFAICYYLQYKGVGFPFEQTQILFTHECFLPSLVEIGPVVL